MKLKIDSIHFDADQKLLSYIEKKIEKVGKLYSRITSIEVKLKLENAGQVKDKIVEIVVKVPGDIILTSADDKKFEHAVDKAVDVLRRRVIKHKEKLRARS
jgi:putative sigma-54 modulation protein